MDDTHRELLVKRLRYMLDNIIMEESLPRKLKDLGVLTTSMVAIIQAEPDPERQMLRMLEMIPKRGPGAYQKFMDCLSVDYPWIVQNFKDKEEELLRHPRANSDVDPQIRQTVKDYVRELARTTRINNAQKRSIEDFLCRHITIDTNLNNVQLPGNKLYKIHKKLLSAIHISSLDESDQMHLNSLLPENVDIEKVETEVAMLVNRVAELEAIIDSCYDKLGETTKEKELPDLIYVQRKIALERGIKMEELKDQIFNQQKKVRLAKDREKKAQEASVKIEEEKVEVEMSLETLKVKIQKFQEDRQKMGMRMAFEPTAGPALTGGSVLTTRPIGPPGPASTTLTNSTLPSGSSGPVSVSLANATLAGSSPRTRSSKSQDLGKPTYSKYHRRQSDKGRTRDT